MSCFFRVLGVGMGRGGRVLLVAAVCCAHHTTTAQQPKKTKHSNKPTQQHPTPPHTTPHQQRARQRGCLPGGPPRLLPHQAHRPGAGGGRAGGRDGQGHAGESSSVEAIELVGFTGCFRYLLDKKEEIRKINWTNFVCDPITQIIGQSIDFDSPSYPTTPLAFPP